MTTSGLDIPPLDPDVDIIKSMMNGDPNALGLLMARHIKSIKSLAWHMLGDEMSAEDIAQEVFLKAWKQAPTWQFGRAKYSTWLYRITKNLCYDRLRKAKEIYSDDPPDMVDERALVSETIDTDEQEKIRNEYLHKALNGLAERQKLAVILYHFENLSQKQAAEIMDINVKAYESLLARGRKALHHALKSHQSALINGFRSTQ